MLLTIRAYTLYLTVLYNVFIYRLIIIYVWDLGMGFLFLLERWKIFENFHSL